MTTDYLTETFSNHLLIRLLVQLEKRNNSTIITYSVDTSAVLPLMRHYLAKMSMDTPIEPLFDRDGHIPDFPQLFPTVPLLLPCKDLNVPRKASRLPNAPRAYRSGIHRGIDFFSNWGTEVMAAADGIIIRSDLHYEEVPADFRIEILKRATRLNRTPSDIFNTVLLGKVVVIDHGFDLFPGFRSITIYAHLSHINPKIKPGYIIKAGDVFAQSGNTGTQPGTMGTREESHLHWELILQDAKGEFYFGQNLPYEKLYPALKSLFNN
jgi:murein DD-endopeptidase MepM/ murein hydrolase activator NlpD